MKRTLLFAAIIFAAAVIFFIALLSPIAKYLIEKYDEKYTGRQITLGWIFVNPFTGFIRIGNLKISESQILQPKGKGDTIFFSAKGLSADFAMLKLFSKIIEISEITLNQPRGIVIQNKTTFNFNDLILKFTPEKKSAVPSAIHFNILNINIKDGEFHYIEQSIPIRYFIRKVNIESDGKKWNSDTLEAKVSLLPGTGTGDLKGTFMVNFKTGGYRIGAVVHKFDLSPIQQYLNDLTNHGSFSANLDADLKAKGNFSNAENLTASGMIAIHDFHFGKTPEDDYASFEKLVLVVTEISPQKRKYIIDSVSLHQPYLKYERYDSLDNAQVMFGKAGSNIKAAAADPARFNLVIEIARYVKVLMKHFFQSYYKINRVAIYRGKLEFNDFAINEKFAMEAFPLFFTADSIDKHHETVHAILNSGVKPYGDIRISLDINPNDTLDFDIRFHLQKLPIAMFNPYVITYTSFPLDRGTIELNGAWKVRDGFLESTNHVVIIDPSRSKRIRNKDNSWLPLPLIMALVRERGNVIDYEIPITGNLKDPKFHLHDILIDVLENIFVKPASTAYRMKVKNAESEIEQSLSLTWGMRKSALLKGQGKFVEKMAGYLADHPDASLNVYPHNHAEKEKEHIQFFEAKKKYFLATGNKSNANFSQQDSEKVDRMSVKDAAFVEFLEKQSRGYEMYTIQEKCLNYVGPALIEARFKQMNEERVQAFTALFKEKDVINRVKIMPAVSHIPYNGFSFYKIMYKGELPDALVKAYGKMNDFNNAAPRKKYQKDRKKAR